jgi:hypothetical protein
MDMVNLYANYYICVLCLLLQVETRAQRQAYIAEQRAKIKSAEHIYDSGEYLAKDDNCNWILVIHVRRYSVLIIEGAGFKA